MGQTERVDAAPIQQFLRQMSFGKASEVDKLFQELSPAIEIDRDAERILFQARLDVANLIRIGLNCTVRLQIHAYAAGVIIAALGTSGFKTMSREERDSLLNPSDDLFTWAVARDLRPALKRREGAERNFDDILQGAGRELTDEVLKSLNKDQVTFGERLFRIASAYILLHELAHLKYRHVYCDGLPSIQQEKEADRFAAEWLIEAASENGPAARLNVLFGVAVALLWLTIFNVFLGKKQTTTHPQGYDRLFQVLDQVIERHDDDEYQMTWYFVSIMLFNHMWAAGFDFDEDDALHMQGNPRDEVNHLIDRIANEDRK